LAEIFKSRYRNRKPNQTYRKMSLEKNRRVKDFSRINKDFEIDFFRRFLLEKLFFNIRS